MTYQNVVTRQEPFSHQSVKMSSYTSLINYCNAVSSSHSVIRSSPLLNVNDNRNFGLKIPGCYGDWRLSHTVLSCIGPIVSCFHISEQDVGNLPVPTFANWVVHAEWLSGLWHYTYVFCILCFFFKIQKTLLFTFFWVVAHVCCRTLVEWVAGVCCGKILWTRPGKQIWRWNRAHLARRSSL